MINKLCVIFCLAWLSPSLLAQPNLALALEACRSELDTQKRLACYDLIPLTENQKAPSAATSVTAVMDPQLTAPAAQNNFGLENRKQNTDNIDEIAGIVTKVSNGAHQKLIIEFDNGQVWRQTDSAIYAVKVGERHHIRRGALGAFYLGNEKSNRRIKVRRDR
ncbi:hypothetical protein ACO1PK_07585 [Alishewanella sp. d11]|uniref:hypothetical protein n=1 Tax=Alishewanella sp. d11 TaxID=3414030 RepID=UPI003BF7C171